MLRQTAAKTFDLSNARLPAVVLGLCTTLSAAGEFATGASEQEPAARPAATKTADTPLDKPIDIAGVEQAKQDAAAASQLWHAAQISVLCASLIGLPFLWLTWRKRADEAFDRRKTNDEIRNGRLESDIRMNIHRFDVDESGQWRMEILNTERVTVKQLFSEQNVYADVLGKAASLCDASQPFPLFNIDKALTDLRSKNYAFVKRTVLPSGRLMSYNLRVRLRDLMSAEYNPERRTLDTDKNFERRRIFGILVREKSPVASTLVLCVLPEKSLRLFGDESWVENLRKNCDEHGRARIDQLKTAYEHEESFLDGAAKKSVFPWANVYFPAQKKKQPSPSLGKAPASDMERPDVE